MSIGKLGADPDAGRYYVRQVASGAEDYYAGHGEAPGVWIGTGSHELGLNGQVLEDGVTRLLAGQRPDTGKHLRTELKPGSVAGFDLCFKAPKSVGLVFGIADEQVSAQVRDGHEAAVREALASPTAPKARPSTAPTSWDPTNSTANGATPPSAATAKAPASTCRDPPPSSTTRPRRSRPAARPRTPSWTR